MEVMAASSGYTFQWANKAGAEKCRGAPLCRWQQALKKQQGLYFCQVESPRPVLLEQGLGAALLLRMKE